MQGLPSIVLLFLNKFDKFNTTGTRMIDSIDRMTLKLLLNHIFGVKTSRFCHYVCNIVMDIMTQHF